MKTVGETAAFIGIIGLALVLMMMKHGPERMAFALIGMVLAGLLLIVI